MDYWSVFYLRLFLGEENLRRAREFIHLLYRRMETMILFTIGLTIVVIFLKLRIGKLEERIEKLALAINLLSDKK